ncbi:kremen protein 2 isoform X3 [Cavia porcellus]|uniref:kremen protein 2 isoform X3 n=1 Tax=Cavia porcellus TaxID=10141 RepID=UPI000661A256
MGTRALLGLLLFIPLLQPRRAWAGSLKSPGLSECFQVNGADYRGHQNHTGPRGTGRPCLFWDQTQQHSYSSASDPQGRWGLGAHNFCRNPDGDVQPWCYVAETEEGIYWRYCDIPTCHMPGYLGCFVDSGTPPALSGPSGTSTKLTVQVCLRFCRMKGYQLAGVEAGYACFCGSESDLARGRGAPATDCDQICFGHPGQLCGGDGRLGIYEAGRPARQIGASRSPLGKPAAGLRRDPPAASRASAPEGRCSPAHLPQRCSWPRAGLRTHLPWAAEHSRGPCTAKGICPDPRGDSWQGQCELQPQACDSAGCNGGPGLLIGDSCLRAALPAPVAAAASPAPTELLAGSRKRATNVGTFQGHWEKLDCVVPKAQKDGPALSYRRPPG